MARGMKRDIISDPLGPSLFNAFTSGSNYHFCRFFDKEKDLLVVVLGNSSPGTPAQWVYDFNQSENGLWNVPWTMPITCVTSGFTYGGASSTYLGNFLIVGTYYAGYSGLTTFVDFSFATMTDYLPTLGVTNYSCNFTISLVRNPTGNHVNMLREPGMVSVLNAIKLDRTKFTSDTDPTLTYYLDNSTNTNGTDNSSPEVPPRRVQSSGYTTLWYTVNSACERVSAKFAKTGSTERFEVQQLAFIWSPDSGA